MQSADATRTGPYHSAQLAVEELALQRLGRLRRQAARKRAQRVPDEARMRHNCNALLGPARTGHTPVCPACTLHACGRLTLEQ